MGLNMGPANANKYALDKPTGVISVSDIRGNQSYKIGADWRIDAFRNRNPVGSQGIWGFGPNETAIPGLGSPSVGGGAIGSAYQLPSRPGDFGQREHATRSAVPEDLLIALPSGQLEDYAQTDARLRPSVGPARRAG